MVLLLGPATVRICVRRFILAKEVPLQVIGLQFKAVNCVRKVLVSLRVPGATIPFILFALRLLKQHLWVRNLKLGI